MMISKATIDKVKLAKLYIQSRYQKMIHEQSKSQQNWFKLISFLNPHTDNIQIIAEDIMKKQTIYSRMLRKKECLQDYKLYNIIGRGAFGQVRVAKNKTTGEVVAIKRLAKKHILQKKHIYSVYLERQLMNRTNSNLLVKLKSSFQDDNYLYIAMQYVQGGDLLRLLCEKQTFSQSETKFYIGQLVLAIQQIHKMNCIHRDIKPENILIDSTGHIKITDFGLSKFMQFQRKSTDQNKQNIRLSKMHKLKKLTHLRNKQKMFSKVGTPDYISPEVLTEKTYSFSTDLWAIGVIMFQCLFGYPPFIDEDPRQVCHRVINWVQYLQFPSDIKISTSARLLMLGLITQENKRLTIEQIKNHPFFQNYNWQRTFQYKPPFIPKIKNDIDVGNFDQFQFKNPWTKAQQKILLNKQNNNQQMTKNANGQIGSENKHPNTQDDIQDINKQNIYKFPGFDQKRLNQDPLERAIQTLKKKFTHKSLSTKKQRNYFQKQRFSIKNTKKRDLNFQDINKTNKSSKHFHSQKEFKKRKIRQTKVQEKQNSNSKTNDYNNGPKNKYSKYKTATEVSQRKSKNKKQFYQRMLNL